MKCFKLPIAALTCLLLFATAHATIWYVHPDSTLNSIQVALNGCTADDTVLVGPGTYFENIIWPNVHGIDLISEFGPDSTVIDGDSAGRVITVTTCVDSLTMIKGFTIQRGYTSGQDLAGGILCDSSSPYICENIITRNIAANYSLGGAGIACVSYASPIIEDNTISYNKTPFGGGGILCLDHSYARITNNVISYNLAWFGGGILCWHLSSPNINGNTISDNVCHHDAALDCHPRFTPRSTKDLSPGRSPSSGGGICCYDASSPLISNNEILANSAEDGAGICTILSNILIRDNIISGNTTIGIWGSGGGICICSDSLTAINNIITGNASQNTGGGIMLYQGYVVIDSCTLSDNGIDGVRCAYYCYDLTIAHSNISGNTRYGVYNTIPDMTVIAESNWWGDSTGPFHPTLNPGGMGDTVSDYVDFDPWLHYPWGIAEQPVVNPVKESYVPGPTVIRGPLQLPKGKNCRVFDITGRVVVPAKITRGVYFIEIDGVVTQKVIKIQ
ncbi:MAG: right-handed parallel beta-helix repeat-containing protein [candidate division WOR-3 bacterium]|nr:right-handed parallel beta-helix repeat-containing protein [candidate division WOR-3 bacterium]